MAHWMERLIFCAAPDVEEARKGRWLNLLLLAFLSLTGAVAVDALLTPGSPYGAADLGVVAIQGGLYLLNRRGRVRLAAGGLALFDAGAIMGAALAFPGNIAITLLYPVMLMVISGIVGVFVSWRALPPTLLVLITVALWYYNASPVPILIAYRRDAAEVVLTASVVVPVLFLATGALAWLASRLIQETVTDLQRRNQELQVAYQDLGAQTERERTLGLDIGGLAAQVSSVCERQVDGTTTQALAISAIVTAVSELNDTAVQIAHLADAVRRAADTALTHVQQAQGLVIHSREVVQRNRAQVLRVIDHMNRLATLTQQITRFTDTIRGLSEETQLLALNATIEAAGAGALGRRFNVVAQEVQQLAHRSDSVVDQIRALITDLHRARQVTVESTTDSIAVAGEVEGLADEVSAMQAQVVTAVSQTNDLVHLITTATAQQNTATRQMQTQMEEIASHATTSAAETRALEDVSHQLVQSAELLTSTLPRWRLPAAR